MRDPWAAHRGSRTVTVPILPGRVLPDSHAALEIVSARTAAALCEETYLCRLSDSNNDGRHTHFSAAGRLPLPLAALGHPSVFAGIPAAANWRQTPKRSSMQSPC